MDEKGLPKTPKGAMMSVVHDAGVISPIVDDDASRLVPAADLMIDDNSPRFLCCCGSCHVTTGAHFVAVALLTILVVRGAFVLSDKGEHVAGPLWLEVIVFLWEMVAVGLLLVGLHQAKRFLLLIYLCSQVVVMVLCFSMASYLIIDLLEVADEHTTKGLEGLPKRQTALIILAIIFYVVMLALETWWFSIVLACYQLVRSPPKAIEPGNNTNMTMSYIRPIPYRQSYGSPSSVEPLKLSPVDALGRAHVK
uniref:Uncharacterized protein n=1 Tax=Plectus sambesii TaxID=2011161 RepID=A0A914XF01_9BILA